MACAHLLEVSHPIGERELERLQEGFGLELYLPCAKACEAESGGERLPQ